LLSRAKKRYYPSYTFTRTSDIWRSREDFLKFEEALEQELKLRAYLDISGGISGLGQGRNVAKTPDNSKDEQFEMPLTPTRVKVSSPAASAGSVSPSTSISKGKRGVVINNGEDNHLERPRICAAYAVKTLFESVYGLWKTLVSSNASVDEAEEEARRRRGLRRFECGTSPWS
jgi:Fanconi-associated nuclease 1